MKSTGVPTACQIRSACVSWGRNVSVRPRRCPGRRVADGQVQAVAGMPTVTDCEQGWIQAAWLDNWIVVFQPLNRSSSWLWWSIPQAAIYPQHKPNPFICAIMWQRNRAGHGNDVTQKGLHPIAFPLFWCLGDDWSYSFRIFLQPVSK